MRPTNKQKRKRPKRREDVSFSWESILGRASFTASGTLAVIVVGVVAVVYLIRMFQ